MDAVLGDAEAVSDAEDVDDRHRTHTQPLLEFEDAFVEVVRVIGVQTATGRLELWNVPGFAVGLASCWTRRRLMSN